MKNILWQVLAFLMTITTVFGQPHLPFKKNNLWGIMDIDGKEIFSPTFLHINFFNKNGYAIARDKEEKQHIIDTKGNIIVSFKNKNLELLESDFIVFSEISIDTNVVSNPKKKQEKFGLMNIKGETILDANYKEIRQLTQADNVSTLHKIIVFKSFENLSGCVSMEGKIMANAEFFEIKFIPNRTLLDISDSKDEKIQNIVINNEKILRDNFVWGVKNGIITYISDRKNSTENTPIYLDNIEEEQFEDENGLVIIHNKEKKLRGLFSFVDLKMVLDTEYYDIKLNKGIAYLFKAQKKLVGVYYKKLILFPPNLDIDNIRFDKSINGYIAKYGNSGTLFLNQDFEVIKNIPQGILDTMSDFKSNIALITWKGKKGLLNSKGIVIAQPIYEFIKRQGTKIRLYKDKKNELCTIITVDEMGNKVDEFEATVKIITIKSTTSIDEEWDMIERAKNENLINNNVRITRNINGNNTFLDEEDIFPSLGSSYIPKPESFKVGAISYELDTIKTKTGTTQWRFKLTKPKQKRASEIQLTQDSEYAFIRTYYYDSEKNLKVRPELINQITGEQVIQYDFQDPVRSARGELGRALYSFKNDYYAIIQRNVLLNKNGTTIRSMDYQNPITKKLEKKILNRIRYFNGMFLCIVNTKSGNDRFIANENGSYGLIDYHGKVIIPAKYNGIKRFGNNRLMKVIIKNKKLDKITYGIIDTSGIEIIPPIYSEIEYLSDGKIKKDTGSYVKLTTDFGSLFALVDRNGKLKTSFKFQEIEEFQENLAVVKIKNKFGVIDKNGNEIIPAIYDKVESCYNGLIIVRLKNFYGIFSSKGAKIVEPTSFLRIGKFHTDFNWISEKGKYSIIDKTGNKVNKATFNRISDFHCELTFAYSKGKWGVINTQGDWIIKPKYSSEGKIDAKNLLIIVKKSIDEFAIFDKNGKQLSKYYKNIGEFKHELAIVTKRTKKTNYIDLQGQEVSKIDFEEIEEFQEGLALFTKNKLQGFLDTTGKICIHPIYSYASEFYNGYAKVVNKNKTYFLNIKGDSLATIPENITWQIPNYVRMNKNKKKIINYKKLNEIKNLVFNNNPPENIKFLDLNNDFFGIGLNNFQGIADEKGQIIIEPDNENIQLIDKNLFAITKQGKLGYWHKEKGWILMPQE